MNPWIAKGLTFLLTLPPVTTTAAELNYGPLPYPSISADAWVLIEVWPTVKDITLSAYFLDISSRKNQNLCEAAKRSLDRDANAIAKARGIPSTAFRECYTLRDAVAKGYVTPGAA